jgi:hypothetical protein
VPWRIPTTGRPLGLGSHDGDGVSTPSAPTILTWDSVCFSVRQEGGPRSHDLWINVMMIQTRIPPFLL